MRWLKIEALKGPKTSPIRIRRRAVLRMTDEGSGVPAPPFPNPVLRKLAKANWGI